LNQNLEKFHESIMFDKGVERYDRNYNKAEEKGRPTPPEQSYKRELFEESILELKYRSETIPLRGRETEWQRDVKLVGAENCVNVAYDYLMFSQNSNKKMSIVKVAEQIGKLSLSLVLDIGNLFKQEDIQRCVRLGVEVINAIVAIPKPAFELTKPIKIGIQYTQSEIIWSQFALDRIKEIYEDQRYGSPMFSPMVIPPRSILEGCYYDERLASRMPLASSRGSSQIIKIRESAVLGARWTKAVDTIQNVGLKLNTEMLSIIQIAYQQNIVNVDPTTGVSSRPFSKIPPSVIPSGLSKREANELKSLQGSFLGEFNEAREFAKEEEIFLPAFVDFRGRVYAVPKLNHQSVDWMKSIWLFAEGKPIDTLEAAKWLKIHLANCGDFGKISKAAFDDRVKWVDENHDRIMKFAQDPFADTEWLYEASEPFCFTAACIEYRKWMTQGDSYVCHLPIAVDGSNSGLQHFSAMARDTFTGKAVNLVPMDKPQDVYQVAADSLVEILESEKDNPLAKEWLEFGISRKTTKRATMTICYGSRKGGISVDKVTRKMKTFGWTEQLMTDIIDGNEHNFENPMKSAVYLANHLDTVLRKIAPKPMEVMDWLQKVAGTLAKFGHPVYWVTPMNFPVINAYYKSKEAQLVTYERGKRVRVRYNYGSTGELITSKQKNGMSPNFVHSCDAAHLQLTALNAKEAGINSVLMIHDSFSCLPADMEKFHKITTDSFVEMYENWDAIQELYLTAVRTIGVENAHLIPEPPKYGDLDLRMVRDSKYAFA
jgi:DNA-directed RNA polymerase, mitochondrial